MKTNLVIILLWGGRALSILIGIVCVCIPFDMRSEAESSAALSDYILPFFMGAIFIWVPIHNIIISCRKTGLQHHGGNAGT